MIAILYATPTSTYKTLPNVTVFDIHKDARTYNDTHPIVAHPPCRAWGRLRHFAKPRAEEPGLAIHAVKLAQRLGGVVEHPASSTLWDHLGLPKPGEPADSHGGWTLHVDQHRFGHKAKKPTWLYIVGTTDLPHIPTRRSAPTHVIRRGNIPLPILSKEERERTPRAFAKWLIEVARRCRKHPQGDPT